MKQTENQNAVQFELDVELMRLQAKYDSYHDWKVTYVPMRKIDEELSAKFGKAMVLDGQCLLDSKTIEVYCGTPIQALHTLRHEYFELLLNPLISSYVDYYNNFQSELLEFLQRRNKTCDPQFMEVSYEQKEQLIENLVNREEATVQRGEQA